MLKPMTTKAHRAWILWTRIREWRNGKWRGWTRWYPVACALSKAALPVEEWRGDWRRQLRATYGVALPPKEKV